MNRTARLFPIGLMLGMGLLAFWLNVLTQWRAPEQRPKNPNEPEYTVEQLTATRFDERGELQAAPGHQQDVETARAGAGVPAADGRQAISQPARWTTS